VQVLAALAVLLAACSRVRSWIVLSTDVMVFFFFVR
jgi:hypothetical protein